MPPEPVAPVKRRSLIGNMAPTPAPSKSGSTASANRRSSLVALTNFAVANRKQGANDKPNGLARSQSLPHH